MKVLIMGSFDPITLGHQYIIEQTLGRYRDLTVCVMINEEKEPLFTPKQRTEMLRLIAEGKFEADYYNGWCYQYCIDNGIELIVRGFRNADDYAYETEMAVFNKKHCGVDTELIYTGSHVDAISSSEVKQRIINGLPINEYVDGKVCVYIKSLFK